VETPTGTNTTTLKKILNQEIISVPGITITGPVASTTTTTTADRDPVIRKSSDPVMRKPSDGSY